MSTSIRALMGHSCDFVLKTYFEYLITNTPPPNIFNVIHSIKLLEACNCEPRGLLSVNSTCLEATGQCQCKPSVTGLRCDHCFDELWGLLTNDTTQGTCKRKYQQIKYLPFYPLDRLDNWPIEFLLLLNLTNVVRKI